MTPPPDDSSPLGDIGNAAIVPQAEPSHSGATNGLARQEQQFYQQSGEQYKLKQGQQDLGILGKFFGASLSAPMNIAGFVIVISMVALLVSLFTSDSETLTAGQERLVGLISSALAFIFGAATKKDE